MLPASWIIVVNILNTEKLASPTAQRTRHAEGDEKRNYLPSRVWCVPLKNTVELPNNISYAGKVFL